MPSRAPIHRPNRSGARTHSAPTDSWRDGKTTAGRGYGWRWQQARRRYLAENPLCVMCRAEGRIEAATVVDHIVPHRGDPEIFWDSSRWQALCKTHHASDKQREEKSGRKIGRTGLDGYPLDPDHHWRRG